VVAGILGVGVGFGGPFLLSVALTASSGDPSFVILPLPFLGALWLVQGLAPAAYTLSERGVLIERRLWPRLIPYRDIRAVDREPRPIGGLLAFGVNSLFGSRGPRWNPRTGLHYLAITNTSDLVFLHTRRGLMVISPRRPDEFARELTRRLTPPPAPAGRAAEERP
jgi:Bacterial PH domain